MQTTTFIYILLAVLISTAVSWFLYFYKSKDKRKVNYLLFGLRFLSLFLLLLLLINPTIERKKTQNKKPVLSILIDNSLSINHFKKENEVGNIVKKIKKHKALNDKFDVQFFSFGEQVQVLDSLSFNSPQTNIYKGLNGVEALYKNRVNPIVLISDGNQTSGNAYEYFDTNKNVFPVVIGDTITQSDLKIEQLNVNKYSYLKNKFPVEVRVLYQGNASVKSQFMLQYKGKTIFRQQLSFSKENPVETVVTTITSTDEGIQYYTATITALTDEKNTENNRKMFSVEVLKEQTDILLLTSILHPDLGVIKKSIETNKQRSVKIENIDNYRGQIGDYQLVILYQPNIKFKSVFERVNVLKSNYFVISGAQTNWNFLNEMQSNYSKKSIQQSEDYGAIFNRGFLTFGQKDISFNTFPPLKDAFGQVTMNSKFDALMYQNIGGIETKTPLFATFENGDQKSGVLFGEGIWKWRAASFIRSNSFQDFDGFLSNTIQYLASNQKRERLSLQYKNIYPANASISLAAFYVDKNYQFDGRAQLSVKVKNTDTDVSQNVSFSLQSNSFSAVLEDLPAGNYEFTVSVAQQSVEKSGKFKITNYQIEKQFNKANVEGLSAIAEKTSGKMYFNSGDNDLINDLLTDKRYVTVQSVITKKESLIEWQLLLILAIVSFSVEWFIRKYYGKL